MTKSKIADVNLAIERAVERSIKQKDRQDPILYKTLHRRFRYWISRDVSDKFGVNWKDLSEDQVPAAIELIEKWRVT